MFFSALLEAPFPVLGDMDSLLCIELLSVRRSIREAIVLEGRLKALADSIVVDIVEEIRRCSLAEVRRLSVFSSCFVVRFCFARG